MRSSDTIELILLVPMLCDPSLLWRRYPKFDLCHQNRYLKYCEFCESSHADRKIAAVDLPFYLQGRVDRTRAGVCLAARNRKEVSGETKPYGEGLITVSICRVWYFVDLDGENQNARRTALPNARQKTHDRSRCRLCPPQSNWGSGTNLHRASRRSRVSENRKSRLSKPRRKKYNIRDS